MTTGRPALVIMFTETVPSNETRGSVQLWAYIMDGDEEIADLSPKKPPATMTKPKFRELARIAPGATIGTGKLVWLLDHVSLVPAVQQ